jgi:serine/threonine-protein kinase HipA
MLRVFFEDRSVGDVHSEAHGPRFVYDKSWVEARGAFPISVTMPLSEREVPPRRFLIWAANLLPEAQQLAMIGLHLGIAQNDVLGLLEAIGRDTAGALSFGAPGRTEMKYWSRIGGEAEIERIIEELPRKPFLAGDDGVSMSLAGVQTKLAISLDEDGHLYIPRDGAPSTHILKPDSDGLPGSVYNEAYCLALAKRCGLAVPPVTTGKAGRRRYFLIGRYDRIPAGAGRWRRLHQEDFCQVLEKPPAAKYERNQTGIPGPTLADMIGAVRSHGLAPDTLGIFDAAVFNILACNTDAHAKNYSLLLPAGRPRIAPLYDVMCAVPFAHVTRNLAQTIAGKARGDHLKRRHWLRFFKMAGLGALPTVRRVRGLAASALHNAPLARADVEAMPAGGHPSLAAIEEAVAGRCRAIIAGLDDPEGSELPA